jgi:hypothetical protein
MKDTALTIQRPVQITHNQIAGILCVAVEGGIGYWANVEVAYTPTDAEMTDSDTYGYWTGYAHYMVSHPDFKLTITDFENEESYTVTLETLKKGLKVMAKEAPRHFDDFINENSDAITGDVFLQCAVFGDVIYG